MGLIRAYRQQIKWLLKTCVCLILVYFAFYQNKPIAADLRTQQMAYFLFIHFLISYRAYD